jgi:hypothetical protein
MSSCEGTVNLRQVNIQAEFPSHLPVTIFLSRPPWVIFSVPSRFATLTDRAVSSIYLLVTLLNWDDGFEFLIQGVIRSGYKNDTEVRKLKGLGLHCR